MPAPPFAEIRAGLLRHIALEEKLLLPRIRSADADGLLARIRAHPPVKLARHNDGPGVCRTAAEALRRSALQAEAGAGCSASDAKGQGR